MGKPWPRIKEYMNLLGSLELHTPKEHADQKNISYVLNKLREFYLYIKQVINSLNISSYHYLYRMFIILFI